MLLRFTPLERLLHRLHLLPAPIMDVFANVLFGRALAIAVRRGLFEALASGPMTEEQIASVTRLHPHALRLLLDSCIVAEYLKREESAYRLTVEGKKWLCKDSPDSLVNFIAYCELLHGHWIRLESSLERGAPVHSYVETFGEEEWRIYALGMRDLARLFLPHVIGKILPGRGARSLLDIGGSHGLYSIECCRRRPEMRATVMDFEPVLAHATLFARQAGVADRVRFHAGDFLTEQFPAGQDAVLMFNIIHGLKEEENRALVARALAALRPGGKLFILDQIREERASTSALGRFVPLMVGLNLLNEIGGTVYSVEQVRDWCRGHQIRKVKLRMPGVTLVEVFS